MGDVWSSAANHGGQLVGALIGIFWVMLGGWWVAIGRRRSVVAAHWQRVVGKIVDKNGGTEGLIARNVAGLSSPPRLHRGPGRSLTLDQTRDLLSVLATHRLGTLFILMLAFGLRRGEALGLAWSNVDWSRAAIHLTHGLKRVQNRAGGDRKTVLVLGELKTARARRTLYLTPELVEMLKRHRAAQEEEHSRIGDPGSTAPGYSAGGSGL